VTGVKNNERFARAGKANVNGKRPLKLTHTQRVEVQSELPLSVNAVFE
jgi:hypothetical protein